MTSSERRQQRYLRRVEKRRNRKQYLNDLYGGYDEVFSISNLYAGGIRCCCNVGWKCSTQKFRENILLHTYTNYTTLKNRIL